LHGERPAVSRKAGEGFLWINREPPLFFPFFLMIEDVIAAFFFFLIPVLVFFPRIPVTSTPRLQSFFFFFPIELFGFHVLFFLPIRTAASASPPFSFSPGHRSGLFLFPPRYRNINPSLFPLAVILAWEIEGAFFFFFFPIYWWCGFFPLTRKNFLFFAPGTGPFFLEFGIVGPSFLFFFFFFPPMFDEIFFFFPFFAGTRSRPSDALSFFSGWRYTGGPPVPLLPTEAARPHARRRWGTRRAPSLFFFLLVGSCCLRALFPDVLLCFPLLRASGPLPFFLLWLIDALGPFFAPRSPLSFFLIC